MADLADSRRRVLVPPAVVVSSDIPGAQNLLNPSTPQVSAVRPAAVRVAAGFVVLDFGRELYGGIRIVVGMTREKRPPRVRVRFGESVTEATTEPDPDHAVHDDTIKLAWLGSTDFGNTGFRFVRLDFVDGPGWVDLQSVWAVSVFHDLPQPGSFECSDPRLNQIWQAGARTVHLCMQEYLWDGIKRDRMVWVGDIHPQARVISAVFGENNIVPASLDFARDESPLPGWMNGISSYSLWWVLIHRDWYSRYGRLEYLQQQRPYLLGLIETLHGHIDVGGREQLTGRRFLDWPSLNDPAAVHAGLQGLLRLAFLAAAELCGALGEAGPARQCRDDAVRLLRHTVAAPGSKPANALMALSGLFDARHANRFELARDPLQGVSTFFGFYILQARAGAGDAAGCLDLIRTYWGGMLDRGGTTFWEDFDLSWLTDSGRIDAVTPPGERDLHADFGSHCYTGIRNSLCHGWAAGPTAWLSEHVLGVTPAAAGFTKAKVDPKRVGLEWVRGKYPTPFGPISVEISRGADGTPETKIDAPPEIELVDGESMKSLQPRRPKI